MSISPRPPPNLKLKLAPLLRMQASDNDGELANASRAITRLLQRHGADWHDVVEVLLAEPPAAAGLTPDATTWKRSSGAVDLPREQLIALIDLVEEHSSFLPLKSREFVASLRSRAWRPVTRLTPRQWDWLQDLIQQTTGK
jgi:hypothetical protein